MCARFVLSARYSDIAREFGLDETEAPEELEPNYNVAPSKSVLVIRTNGRRHAVPARWGLLPPWARDTKLQMINARAETIDQKKSFSRALRESRCIIPADGFYEWKHEGARKEPWYFRLASGRTMRMAGLLSQWTSKDGESVLTFSIITTEANSDVAPVHGRMPVILPPGPADEWLDPGLIDTQTLKGLLNPIEDGALERYPVGPAMNSPRRNSPDNIRPLA